MNFRKLNQAGIDSFTSHLMKLKDEPRTAPPHHLLADPATSEEMPFAIQDRDIRFSDRVSLGSYLKHVLADHKATVLHDSGLWSGLALHWFDQLCSPRADGQRRPGEKARYILDSRRSAYRHLIWASWWAVETYGDTGKYLILPARTGEYPLEFGGGDVMGQIAANQMTTGSTAVIELGRRLYADAETGRQRRGSGGKGAGSPRRLVQVLRQFELTYDFSSMDVETLAALLPAEFRVRLKGGT